MLISNFAISPAHYCPERGERLREGVNRIFPPPSSRHNKNHRSLVTATSKQESHHSGIASLTGKAPLKICVPGEHTLSNPKRRPCALRSIWSASASLYTPRDLFVDSPSPGRKISTTSYPIIHKEGGRTSRRLLSYPITHSPLGSYGTTLYWSSRMVTQDSVTADHNGKATSLPSTVPTSEAPPLSHDKATDGGHGFAGSGK